MVPALVLLTPGQSIPMEMAKDLLAWGAFAGGLVISSLALLALLIWKS